MSKDEVDCEDPENADHPDCQCDFDDGDRQYDAWADERVIQFYERLEGRADLYKTLLAKKQLSDPQKALHEKMLIENLTGRRVFYNPQLHTERKELMQQLLELWNDTGTHTNNVNKRDRLEKKLVLNLTGSRKLWQNINSIHDEW